MTPVPYKSFQKIEQKAAQLALWGLYYPDTKTRQRRYKKGYGPICLWGKGHEWETQGKLLACGTACSILLWGVAIHVTISRITRWRPGPFTACKLHHNIRMHQQHKCACATTEKYAWVCTKPSVRGSSQKQYLRGEILIFFSLAF